MCTLAKLSWSQPQTEVPNGDRLHHFFFVCLAWFSCAGQQTGDTTRVSQISDHISISSTDWQLLCHWRWSVHFTLQDGLVMMSFVTFTFSVHSLWDNEWVFSHGLCKAILYYWSSYCIKRHIWRSDRNTVSACICPTPKLSWWTRYSMAFMRGQLN